LHEDGLSWPEVFKKVRQAAANDALFDAMRGNAMPSPADSLIESLKQDARELDKGAAIGRRVAFAEIAYRDAAGRLRGRRVVDVRDHPTDENHSV
jgi:hypothetical protein